MSKLITLFVDFWVIVLEVTYFLSMTKVMTFDKFNVPYNIILILFICFIHLYRFGGKFPIVKQIRANMLLKLYFLIFIIDFIQISIQGTFAGVERLGLMINMFFFIDYLYSVVLECKYQKAALSRILSPYLIYCLYNAVTIIIAGLLIFLGYLSPMSNMMDDNSLIHSNLTVNNLEYSFPGYLSLANPYSFRVLGLWGVPVLSGLSHEPHVICYLILPSFFLGHLFIKKGVYRIILYIITIFVLLFSFSTTAILCFMFLFVVEILWNFVVARKTSGLLILGLIIILIACFGQELLFLINLEVETKVSGSTDESMEYSSRMLNYICNPHGLIGYGNMPPSVEYIQKYDMGIITSALDISLYVLMLYYSLKYALSKDELSHYVGMGCLYYSFHCLKVNMLMFQYPYFAFIIFLLSLMKKKSVIKKIQRYE